MSANRFKRLTLLVRFLLRAIFYGVADKMPSKISCIAVVPDGKLGDVVCATPVFTAIRKAFPHAHIIAVGNPNLHRPILSHSALVDEYIDLDEQEIKKHKIDIGLITGPSFESAATLYLASVSLITVPVVEGGFSPLVTRPYKIISRFLKTYPYKMGEYAPREKLRSLEPIGIISDDTTKHLGFSREAESKVLKYFDSGFNVGLTPTAGHKIKEWPEERFVQVADYLVEKYHAKVFDISKMGLNLDELKAFISKLNLFISVDTGPIYIAEAFNIPTIDITGPIDEAEQPPRGKFHRNVIPRDRLKPELFVLNAKSYDREEALRQVLSITPEMVEKEVDAIMSDLGRSA